MIFILSYFICCTILYDFIHQISSTPFPNKRGHLVTTWSPPVPLSTDELLVQRARLRKGRLERNARVNDLVVGRMVGSVGRLVVVTHDM